MRIGLIDVDGKYRIRRLLSNAESFVIPKFLQIFLLSGASHKFIGISLFSALDGHNFPNLVLL